MNGLGRRPATDDNHVRKYGLTVETMPEKPTPVCLGINWYSSFDKPNLHQDKQGNYWLKQTPMATIRGGHEICLKPPALRDLDSWWEFYDQGEEGACVGFALSRMMSLLNRKRYDAFWLYHEAQKIDDWPGEDYDGTSGRAGCDVLRDVGHRVVRAGISKDAHLAHGILVNRWCLSVEQIAACLSPEDNGKTVLDLGYVIPLNSWGKHGYPHESRMDLETLNNIVYNQDGDATLVTDR